MATLFHRSRQRRSERSSLTAHGNINLVPLVDILTSIVFFSLLTYQGTAVAALTAFDLALPPVIVTTPEEASRIRSEQQALNLLLAVRVESAGLLVEHSGAGGYSERITGMDDAAMVTLQRRMQAIRSEYPQNRDVLVIPTDEVNYDNVVRVLERLRMAGYTGLSLGTRARSSRVAGRG
jgi:biopolymer transport protein ExbD